MEMMGFGENCTIWNVIVETLCHIQVL